MTGISYLSQRRDIFFFRRRIPGFSTLKRPVLLSLGTTDRRMALKFCRNLSAQMDRMLDDNLHMTLPEAEVVAFFQAELQRCLTDLRTRRLTERIDGSLTEAKLSENRLNALILRTLVEHGLREDVPADVLSGLAEEDRKIATALQAKWYREFLSPGFNAALQGRAFAGSIPADLTQGTALRLRWAALEARAAAHQAVETVPLHHAEQAVAIAVNMLTQMMTPAGFSQAVASPCASFSDPNTQEPAPPASPTHAADGPHQSPHTPAPAPETMPRAPILTPGVDLIRGRITVAAVDAQRAQALAQPTRALHDGIARQAGQVTQAGADILGTAVRMTRMSRNSDDGTKAQKLRSATLFVFVTGIQIVSDVRQEDINHFADVLEARMPKTWGKAPKDRDMTCHELIRVAEKSKSKSVGLSRSTIERHLTTIRAVISHAKTERNYTGDRPEISNLLPRDTRSDDEKRTAFSFEQLAHLFQHPRWQGYQSKGRPHTPGDQLDKDHHYWINLILAYTGARRAEIAGLLVEDFGTSEGIPFIHIRPNRLRGIKNRHSKRRVPVHPHLMELGFAEFVRRAGRAKTPLFPGAIRAKDRKRLMSAKEPEAPHNERFGDVLDHTIRECIARRFDGNPTGLCLHSIRHYVNEAFIGLRCEDGITQLVPDLDRRTIMGHQPLDVNEATYRTSDKPLRPLYEAIKRLPRLF